ncbi:[FeFe] hydrogenase H-cluster maturation GTPase HydF [Natronincola ferrireducens]|uniref:Iron-only hydrogenase maturation protein HydF n=1 Tax=Natronincola ferrireducens TaxID=393762 RepID=A0A1G9J8I6_9FIRM|nr:[FeFe] hydrogenase H-cluster maturation GTPase HydF [Natronincola ferrireducens]SDL33897.1 iron-only hydrogenase maturation protein HydF [Natronincola ferrireducens]
MNNTPRGNRLHIAIFGRRNAGKSSLINALTNQDTALVSDIPGTTTDPVYKTMEILPIGPVLIIDTAGIDDEGVIGELRTQKTKEVLNKTDLALIVTNLETGIGTFEEELLTTIKEKDIPTIIVYNKWDIIKNPKEVVEKTNSTPTVLVSAKTNEGIDKLKERIIAAAPKDIEVSLMGGLVERGDTVVLVTPIDTSAPKGRMILPQVQVIRDILDHDAFMIVCKETELQEALGSLKNPPKLVVTDSQAFAEVSKIVPPEIALTSFSILFARYKGDLRQLVEGVKAIKKLKKGDRVLIVEGCTHHRQEDDIGTVKIPRWLEKETGESLDFHWVSGNSFREDLSEYSLIVHCGACMQNRREMMARINKARGQNVPIINYGVLISHVTGIMDRVIAPFQIEIQ